MLGQFVSVLDHDHKYYLSADILKFDGYRSAPTNIGDNVWVGEKSTILKGVQVGNNTIIAANSVVNNNLESNGVYAGSPAKLIKKINSEG